MTDTLKSHSSGNINFFCEVFNDNGGLINSNGTGSVVSFIYDIQLKRFCDA